MGICKVKPSGFESVDEFEKWVQASGIRVHPNVCVDESSLGGFGLFFDTKDIEKQQDEIVDLVRIPSSSLYSYESLLEKMAKLRKTDVKSSSILSRILERCPVKSETEIILCYITGFHLIKQSGSALADPDLQNLLQYLEVLKSTEVLCIPDNFDDHGEESLRTMKLIRTNFEELYKEISSVMKDFESKLPFDLFYQYAQAIRSRVLEIPKEINKDEEDFTTDTTLVPFLDFANHEAKPNSYFDVDRHNGDVILKLDLNEVKEDAFEITICYHLDNSVNSFLNCYGFVPDNEENQIFPLSLSPYVNELLNKMKNTTNEPYDLISKWMFIDLSINLIRTNNQVTIDFASSRLPYLLIDGLNYYKEWSEETDDIAQFEQTAEASVDEIITNLKNQEKNNKFVYSEECLGVTYLKEQYVDPSLILEQTGNDNEQSLKKLTALAVELILEASKLKLLQLEQVKADSGIIQHYFQVELRVLTLLLDQNNQKLLEDAMTSLCLSD
ncbi:SET domain-containing protein [Hyphopichia burtonii NRRL Y-1933]|uniref:SET domain-containing protein n=1 Tax=Hyphopichia burtonii NRRL Y-1933 TaxID=984485 RepID=A0A1E4RLI0_9ASCO|nr:SET domain-containing protein [Hyphopichia burtonii NRRL Y-1933]ODV68096.1 SET domain-containing protein [Hyphopichia burtonii NRRL Y-1933]